MKILVPELTIANLGIPQSSSKRWEASLLLEFTKSSTSKKTLLSRREHFGPLMIQKALYPEGDEICHAVVLHPPAGIAGGDHLHIEINISYKHLHLHIYCFQLVIVIYVFKHISR